MGASTDSLVREIAKGVLDEIKPYLEKQTARVVSEEELMEILGVKGKGTMAEYRKRGLKGHRIDYRHRVYFWDDVEDFIRAEGLEWQ